jgi:multidrug efflux pump subunit AcrA (membrane-fusion protein)
VKEYDRIVTISDPSQLEIQMELYSEDDFRRITPGQPVKVEITKGNWSQGEISQLPSYAERNATGAERDRRVRIKVNNPGVQVKMNDMMNAVILVQEKNDALKIPKSALREFMGRSYVRVMEGDTRKEIDVEVGIRGATEVEIIKGLKAGQEVICK